MTKCDFCVYSSPNGCSVFLLSDRKPKCEKAINRMIDALQDSKSCLCHEVMMSDKKRPKSEAEYIRACLEKGILPPLKREEVK